MDAGENVNEVEAAGNTPLHNAAYEGWTEGIDLLISLGAKVNASNNAGDRPWHWARNMGQTAAMAALENVRPFGCCFAQTDRTPHTWPCNSLCFEYQTCVRCLLTCAVADCSMAQARSRARCWCRTTSQK